VEYFLYHPALSIVQHPVTAKRESSTVQESMMGGNQDMRAANESYAGFLTMFKWGTILAVLTTILVVLVIA
jgi:hypothetical protein